MKRSPALLALVAITPGKMHGWFATSLGFPVRKPLGAWRGRVAPVAALPEAVTPAPVSTRPGIFSRFVAWLKNIFQPKDTRADRRRFAGKVRWRSKIPYR